MGIDEVAHQMALAPVFLLGIGLILGRDPERDHLLFAAALGTSWIGDSIARFAGSSFDHIYLWAPVQIALTYAAVVQSWTKKRVTETAIVYSVALTAHVLLPDKTFILWSIGGIGLIYCGRNSPLVWPIFVYFGLGTVAYFFMLERFRQPDFMQAWYAYQGCRAIAIMMLCGIIIRSQRGARVA